MGVPDDPLSDRLMTPRELLDLADELSTDDREAAWRTAAHCAYYAAFHVARSLLSQLGFVVPDADRAHGYLWLRFQNSGHPDVAKAGRDLSEARTVRNGADYDLAAVFTRKLATSQVVLAEGIIETLEQVAGSPATLARITPAMRDYERDVLREVTWRGGP
jgi:uncharacterized protein (UPF0332 family)